MGSLGCTRVVLQKRELHVSVGVCAASAVAWFGAKNKKSMATEEFALGFCEMLSLGCDMC